MKNVLESTAVFMHSDAQFDRWEKVRWEGINNYLAGKSKEIYPAMYGTFYKSGKRYLCNANGIKELKITVL